MKLNEKKPGKNSSETMSRSRLKLIMSAVASILLLAVLALALFSCGNSESDGSEEKAEWASPGTYYYSADGVECELTLQSDWSFTLVYNGKNESGTFTGNSSAIKLDFAAEGKADADATFDNGVLSLTYDGAVMRMLKKVSFNVSFNTNGGSAVDSVTVLNGKKVEKPADPTRKDYVFVGWYKDAEFKAPYIFGTDIVTKDTTIYARWVMKSDNEVEYNVTFDVCCDDVTAPNGRTTLSGKLFDAPILSREGYTFCGWWISTDNDSSKLSYKCTEETVFTEDTTLFALWMPKGTSRLEPPSLNVSDKTISWSRVSGARSYEVTVTDALGNTVFTKSTTSTSVNVSFSDYDAGIYYIRVSANSNTGENDNSEAFFTFANKALGKVNKIFVDSENTLVFEGVENAEKYLITVVCGNADHNHKDFDNKNSKTFSFANCPMTADGISFVIKAVADGYITSVSETFVYKRELSEVGGFVWNEEKSELSWNEVSKAEYYVISVACGDSQHNHTFLGKNNEPLVDLRECTPKDGGITVTVYPVADGYVSAAASVFTVNKASQKTPSNVSVNGNMLTWESGDPSAVYEVKVNEAVYQITNAAFDLSAVIGGEAGEKYDVSVRIAGSSQSAWSKPITVIADAIGEDVRYDKNTLYWNHVFGADYYELQVNNGDIIKVENTVSARINLTASGVNTVKVRFVRGESRSEWTEISVTAYAVSFDTVGGNSIATQYVANGDEIALPTASRAGYDFVCWYNVPGGPSANGKRITDNVFKGTEDTVLYAHYEPKKYEITYNYGIGGTGLGIKDKVEYNGNYVLEIPTANDPTTSFGGWYSAPYGNGTRYTDSMGNSVAPWTTLGDATLYAFWVDETFRFEPARINGRDVYAVFAGTRISLVNEVTVPAYHNGLPVAVITGGAFADCNTLKRVNLPETLQMISNLDPFSGCAALTEINVYSVDGISSPRYTSVDGVLFENKSDGAVALISMPEGRVGEYVIPNGTTEVADGAFEKSSLSAVTVPASVTKIANDAFINSKQLVSISFEAADSTSKNTLTVGKRAFAGCTALKSVSLPAHLDAIELTKYYINASGNPAESADDAFYGCTSLSSISISENSSTYKVIDGMIYSKDGRTLIYCPVTVSGKVTVPARTQYIDSGAFIGCEDITEIVIPNTVTYIGAYAFYATSITNVTFISGGYDAVTIGDYAFKDCKSLKAIAHKDKNGAESDGIFAMISVIGIGAFSGCNQLSEFVVVPGVTEIRNRAFENCASLSSVRFMPSGKNLEFGKDVFYNCTSLTTMEIPANASKIPGIFAGCTSLSEVKVAEGNEYFTSVDGVIFNIDKTEIIYYPAGRKGSYTIPDSVRTIASGVFRGIEDEEMVLTIPNSVSYIGEEAFRDTIIGKIVFSGGIAADSLTIGRAAFMGANFENYNFELPAHTKHIEEYAFSQSFFQSLILNEGLETIGDYAFYHPSNETVTLLIPASVTTIGKYCFTGETRTFTIQGVTHVINRFVNVSFTTENSKLTSIGDYAFYKNVNVTSVELPDSVKSIGNYAFFECKEITSVKLPASLETIGAYAFASDSYANHIPITAIEIPANVSSIGAYAFKNCHSLTKVSFMGTLDSPDLVIGTTYLRSYVENGIDLFSVDRGNVFASCKSLTEVNLSPNVTVLGDYTFAESGIDGFEANFTGKSRLSTIGAYCFYKSGLTSFTVPATVRNLPYTQDQGETFNRLGIGEYAFAASAGKLTEIIFEKGDTQYPLTIGAFAFMNQSKIEAIELPARLASYPSYNGDVIAPLENGSLVFNGMRSLASISVEAGSGTYAVIGGALYTSDVKELVFCPMLFEGSIEVPSSVTVIQSYAFNGCKKLSAITFKNDSKLERIEYYAFNGCSLITDVVLPDGVTVIGEGAFNYCSALENITLSNHISSFDVEIINGCTSLKNIFVREGSEYLSSDYGVLYSADKTLLICYPMGRTEASYTVNDNVISIGKYAFSGNVSLEVVILPDGLREIKDGAFMSCTALSTVIIPNTLELIGEEAFAYAALDKLTFETGGAEKLVISDGAFEKTKVAVLELPARLAIIGNKAFSGSKLATLTFENSSVYCLTEIGNEAFKETPLVSVTFPSGIESVGAEAFLDTTELEKVVFGEGLKAIGDSAFKNSAIGEIYLPASLKTMGADVFYNCNRLMSVTFAANCSLEVIPEGAFYGCSALKSFTVPAYVKEIGGVTGKGAFNNCTSLEGIVFESNINCKVIGNYAFFGCAKLASFELPVSVESLGKYAFANCKSITEIVIPLTTTELGENLFAGCTALAKVDLKTGTESLPKNMFSGCVKLTYVCIPKNVSEIGSGCFSGTSIEKYEVDSENVSFVAISGIVYNAAKTEMVCFPPNATSSTLFIPKGITNIPTSNFEGNVNIKEVIFEEGGTVPLHIGDKAFYGCSQLRKLVLPERLVSIGEYAFMDCIALTSVTIPKNVTSIGNFAFSWCHKLYEVRNESAIENIGSKGSIKEAQSNVNIYTPTEGASVLFYEGDYLFATVNGVKTLIGYEGDGVDLVLPSGSYQLAGYLFHKNTAIKSVIIPNTVSIDDSTLFTGCKSLEIIMISGGSVPSSWHSGWNGQHKFVEGYTGNDNTYNFHIYDNSIPAQTTNGIITLPTPAREGYVFLGWYDNPSFTGEAFEGIYYSSSKTDLYARFMEEAEYIEEYLRGQSMEYAYDIVSGAYYAVKINTQRAQNYYKITATAGDVLNILTSGSGSHKIWIYDANGNLILEYDSRTTYHVDYDYTFTKNSTYYIGVGYKGTSTGTYTVTFTEK